MGKNIENAYELLKEMARNAYRWPFKCNAPKKTLGVYELDVFIALSSQVTSLFKQLSLWIAQANVIITLIEACDLYGGPHTSMEC